MTCKIPYSCHDLPPSALAALDPTLSRIEADELLQGLDFDWTAVGNEELEDDAGRPICGRVAA